MDKLLNKALEQLIYLSSLKTEVYLNAFFCSSLLNNDPSLFKSTPAPRGSLAWPKEKGKLRT